MASANRNSSFALFRLGPRRHFEDPDIQPSRRADAAPLKNKSINLVVVEPNANFCQRIESTLRYVVEIANPSIWHPAIDLHGQATIKRFTDFAELLRYVAMIFATDRADDCAASEMLPVVVD
jgi:hypothetical protein